MRIQWIVLVAMGVALAAAPGARAQQCDDFDSCTKNDMCVDGACMGTPASGGSCDDFNDCTINDHCGPDGGCIGDDAPVNTSCAGGCGKCTQLVPIPGIPLQCSGDVADSGKSCDATELNPCLVGTCQIFGVPGFPAVAICLPAAKTCPDAGNCKGACNPENGQCNNNLSRCFGACERCQQGQCVPANLGSSCDDFNGCTAQSRCEQIAVGEQLRGLCMAGEATGDTPTPTATVAGTTPTAPPTATEPPTVTRTRGTPPTPGPCVGDCNSDGTVAINELITGVNIALGNAAASTCPSFDTNSDGSVAVNELISGVNALLNGCAG